MRSRELQQKVSSNEYGGFFLKLPSQCLVNLITSYQEAVRIDGKKVMLQDKEVG